MTNILPDKSILNKEEYPGWCTFFDGLVNIHRYGIRIVVISL